MNALDGARRAVAYLRLSERERAAGGAAGSDEQRNAISTWAAHGGVEVASWHVDMGVGGETPIAERPGLVAAYRALQAQRAGVLVAANADRFSRDELVRWLIERAALTQGAAIRTADGSRGPVRPLSAPQQEEISFTRGAIALARAHERVIARERIRAGLAARRARGERVGTLPFGYRLASDGLHIEPDPAEQTVVSTVRRLREDGLSQRAIAAKLAASGVTGRTGASLRQTQVANILRSAS